jgi:hypothetical protein
MDANDIDVIATWCEEARMAYAWRGQEPPPLPELVAMAFLAIGVSLH